MLFMIINLLMQTNKQQQQKKPVEIVTNYTLSLLEDSF